MIGSVARTNQHELFTWRGSGMEKIMLVSPSLVFRPTVERICIEL